MNMIPPPAAVAAAAPATAAGFSVEQSLAAFRPTNGGGTTVHHQEAFRLIYGPGGQIIGGEMVTRTIHSPPPLPPNPIINEDPERWAKEFAEYYYSTMEANHWALGALFREDSMLTFEGQQILGKHNIMSKFASLPFDRCHHIVTAVDWQPSPATAGMLLFVSGDLHLAGDRQAHKFTEIFYLMPAPEGGYYVLNDMFRSN